MKTPTTEQINDALAFIGQYGQAWKGRMHDFHLGRPGYQAVDMTAPVRRIRNNLTPNPDELESMLKKAGKLTLVAGAPLGGWSK